jgi:proteasome lid subunit RPN8/RPN11
MKRNAKQPSGIDLHISCEAVRQIRQHAHASTKSEVCGVLVGSDRGGVTSVEASIQGANSLQAGTHVTFTQDTWEHIYRIKDREYPEARIVGWYHSHPGFGVFLSDHDTFIHRNFFSAPHQIAWVYDPHSDEEGCFGWIGEDLERLQRIVLVDEKGGEKAGETGKPEPLFNDSLDDKPGSSFRAAMGAPPPKTQSLADVGITILKYLCVLALGFIISWYLFPRLLIVPVDPRTGQPIFNVPVPSSAGSPAEPDAGKTGSTNNQNAPATHPADPASQGAKGKP